MSTVLSDYVLLSWVLLAVAIFISLLFVKAPYGRYISDRYGAAVEGRLGWVVMEAPAPLIFAACFLTGVQSITITQIVFLVMWQSHYLHRTFIYPFNLRISAKPLPLIIVAGGFLFNVVNAYLNGGYIACNGFRYPVEWLGSTRFLFGLALFIMGFVVNRHADLALYRIRRMEQNIYGIPSGGFFRWVSCPNYLGEIVMWLGWAVATWSVTGAAFAAWTVANLAPRARAHHRWYIQYFEDYPKERRALIPGLW